MAQMIGKRIPQHPMTHQIKETQTIWIRQISIHLLQNLLPHLIHPKIRHTPPAQNQRQNLMDTD